MYGPSAASLISAQVVTADGRTLEVDEQQNADLLWGLRGGGGNFGVVTQFGFRLHPVGPIVQGGMNLHPASVARELMRFYRDCMAAAPDEVGGPGHDHGAAGAVRAGGGPLTAVLLSDPAVRR
jgi:FAD/FMN-containing dehydrogenase